MKLRDCYSHCQSVIRPSVNRRPFILFWTQITLLTFLLFVLVLSVVVNTGTRALFYSLLISLLLGMMLLAFYQNLHGKYQHAAFLTVLAMVIGPWGSIFLDPAVLRGDIIPMLYITLSIQLCSILLPEKHTVTIAVFHFILLCGCLLFYPALREINWPSLLAYLLLTSIISILTSLLSRKYINEISAQKEQLQHRETQLREAAARDALTGLYNRRHMTETIQAEIRHADDTHHPVGIIMLDIDHFKTINDNCGHMLGDFVISSVACILQQNTRNLDWVCRYGGDEFVVILPGSDLESTEKRADAMCQMVEVSQFTHEGHTVRTTLSVGVSAFPACAGTEEALLQSADLALYAAKTSGRNRVVAAQPDCA